MIITLIDKAELEHDGWGVWTEGIPWTECPLCWGPTFSGYTKGGDDGYSVRDGDPCVCETCGVVGGWVLDFSLDEEVCDVTVGVSENGEFDVLRSVYENGGREEWEV